MSLRAILPTLSSLLVAGSLGCSALDPLRCDIQVITIEWPATISQNGVVRSDSLKTAGANTNSQLGGGIFDGMRTMLIDGQTSSTWNGVSWALPFAADGSIVGFAHLAPLNVGDSLPIVFDPAIPVGTARNLPADRTVRANFFTYGDAAQIASASGYMRVLQRSPFRAAISVTAVQVDGKTVTIQGTVGFSFNQLKERC